MCLTCSIIKNEKIPPGGVIYKNGEVIIHHCIDVNVPGYLVVSSIRHVGEYQELTDKELITIARILKSIVGILYKISGVEKVYILNFAEQTKHFHFHIFPRYSWMIDKTNIELFSGELLDGAKLFSYYRRENKLDDLVIEPQISKTIDFIKCQLSDSLQL